MGQVLICNKQELNVDRGTLPCCIVPNEVHEHGKAVADNRDVRARIDAERSKKMQSSWSWGMSYT